MVRFAALSLILFSAPVIFAQDTTSAPAAPPNTANSNGNPIVNLASSFFEHDFFNFFLYGDGVYDTYAPVEQNGHTVNNGGTGFDVGGGVNAYHGFREGEISLTYRGSYRDYQSGFFTSGTDQMLSLGISKRLTRRWSITWGTSAGIFLYGGTFVPAEAGSGTGPINPSNPVIPNPFSPETKYLSTGLSMAYRQTARLSYILSGDFFVQRYNYPGSLGVTGVSGGVGVQYRLAPRTTLTGSYSHGYYHYQRNAGSAFVDTFGGTLNHVFPSHWMVTLFGGVSRTDTSGIALVPVTLIIQQGTTQEAVGGYVLGHFERIAHIPTFSGTVSHLYRRSTLSFSAGQGVVGAGNGYYLSSKTDYVNGFYSYNIQRRSNFGMGGTYYRLSSVANKVTAEYSSASFSASYSTVLVRHVGAFARYDFIHYGNLNPLPAVSDNRIAFGFNYSSRSVPMTLF